MGAAFITLTELIEISGVDYDEGKLTRAEVLLPLVSDLIRNEGKAAGVDVDARIETDAAYASVVMLVCADVIARALRQATTGEPMSQESQSGLGYSWSGTYAIPGGGVAMSLMRNERKMLGFRRQKYGVMEIWDGSQEEQ
jgi:hypothetical protein